MDPDDIFDSLEALHEAVAAHALWLKEWHRAFFERRPGSPDNLAADAHRRCAFGRWYEGAQPLHIEQHPAFAALGATHKAMHDQARDLAVAAANGKCWQPAQYGQFLDLVLDLNEQIRTIQYDVTLLLAKSDPLTGLYSRSTMARRLREEHARSRRMRISYCVALIDIDNFKSINDGYGHSVGDTVLQATAKSLSQHLRPYDYLFRFGGDEFLLCLPHTDTATAHSVLSRLRLEVEQASVPVEDHENIRITASFGLACLVEGVEVETLLDRADHALYQAKRSGRNCVRIWGNDSLAR